VNNTTCNEPSKQETVQDSIERIGASVVVVAVLSLVVNSLHHVGQILDDTEAAADHQVDRYVALIWTVMQIHRAYSVNMGRCLQLSICQSVSHSASMYCKTLTVHCH